MTLDDDVTVRLAAGWSAGTGANWVLAMVISTTALTGVALSIMIVAFPAITKDFSDTSISQLSWISKYSKAIRNGVKQWPMEYVDGGSDLEKGQRYTYRMPSEVAGWWLAAVVSS